MKTVQPPIRLLLSADASRHLDATEEGVFLVVHKAMRGVEEPSTAGRWAITLIPCSIHQADSAVRVALGLSKESKPRAPKA